jgi:sugar-specific transcriptional regulator TrmB
LRSRKVIRKKLEDMVQHAERVLLLINISDMRNIINVIKRVSKNREVNVIAPVGKDNIALVKKWMRFADVRHYETSIQEKVAITKDAVLIFELSSPLALYSNDPKFVSMFSSFFEAEWNLAIRAEEKIKEVETGKPAEEIVFVRGRESLYRMLPDLYREAKKDILITTSKNGAIRIFKYLNKYLGDAKTRNVKVRLITTVTRENMEIAKKINAEVRHVDKIHAVLACYDGSVLSMHDIKNDSVSLHSPDDTVMITNNSGMINMMKQMLENMWEHAMPLEERIAELETGRPREETYYIYGRQKLYEMIPQFMGNAKDVIWTAPENGLERIYSNLKGVIDLYKGRARIQCLAPITKANIEIAKKLGIEIRHVDKIYAIADCYDDSLLTIITPQNNNPDDDEIIVTNKHEFVKMIRQMLENMWEHATPLEKREKELTTQYTLRDMLESVALEKMFTGAHEEKEV